jgi:hypothetical protein
MCEILRGFMGRWFKSNFHENEIAQVVRAINKRLIQPFTCFLNIDK